MKSTRFAARLVILLTLTLIQGCSSFHPFSRKPQAPAFVVNTKPDGSRSLTQSGDAATPANISSVTSVSEIPLPPGSTLTLTTASPGQRGETEVNGGGLVHPLPVARITETRERITSPTAFAPPAGPSAVDSAKAQGVLIFYWLAAAMALACGLFVYLGHIKAAVVAGVGAIAAPLLVNFVSHEWAIRALLITGVGSIALYAAWHFIAKNNPELAEKEARIQKEILAMKALRSAGIEKSDTPLAG